MNWVNRPELRLSTPIGILHLVKGPSPDNQVALLRAGFEEEVSPVEDPPWPAECLGDWLRGVSLMTPGGTVWDRKVWKALDGVLPGAPVSYGELARRLGRPGAARAVGGALARNPIALWLPCHRVRSVEPSGGGYRWGGWRKERLLSWEAAGRSAVEVLFGSACARIAMVLSE